MNDAYVLDVSPALGLALGVLLAQLRKPGLMVTEKRCLEMQTKGNHTRCYVPHIPTLSPMLLLC